MFEDYIYLDNASMTRLDERVFEKMKTYFFDIYAIPTSESGYSMGVEAKETLEKSRENIAQFLGAETSEFIFTSGFTESSNIAIKGVVGALKGKKGSHIIISKIEDYSVLNTVKALEKEGCQVTYLEVDPWGQVDPEVLKDSITSETILVSIQHANQEIGTIQNIKSIGEVCQEKEIIFHTDATHSFTRIPLDVKKIPVDLVTLSAHTIHGPSGIGGLYIRKGTPLKKWMDGGFQESNRRSGLENIPGAVGFSKAVDLVTAKENQTLKKMRDHLIDRILSEIPQSILNGHRTNRTPQNANITFEFVEGESITLHLDLRGFGVSTGSACFSRSLDPSHVILGIGGNHERAHGSIRFTFSRFTTMDDVNRAADAVASVVENLRKISPLG
ncbi:MAG: cysteine desulfurase [Euryarchaeota archaeon]|nr:cysteine desulfurase [Euryarchaeota archaeon]MBU4607402.1 cysteine desulfurase [Euryarchaeota archaeon]MBV1729179.1 cysteine desulfurase [Methanobacterium sp.]MBV1755883.1 cysteine desulfurase [Methanobacterium sp.]